MNTALSALRINFLYVDRYSFGRTWTYPTSHIPYCMLRYIITGTAEFVINGDAFPVRANEIIYVPEGCSLSCQAREDNFTFISIRFHVSVRLASADILGDYFGIQRVTACDDPNVFQYFAEVLKSAQMNSQSKIFRIRGNLELIIAYLAEKTNRAEFDEKQITDASYSIESIRRRVSESASKQDSRIQAVVDYLVANPSLNLDTARLCELANMSHTSLRRSFKAHTGKTLNDFIKDLRMMTAARRILVTEERIAAIAYQLGFADPNYFARKFREVFGVSPQQYRKTARE